MKRMPREKAQDIIKYVFTCPDKDKMKSTTSISLKIDLLKWAEANEVSSLSCIEMGIAHGYTTSLLARLFNRVIAVDNNPENVSHVSSLNIENISVESRDLYSPDFLSSMAKYKKIDVAFIDAQHTEAAVISDYQNAFDMGARVFIFDDFGLDPAVHTAVSKIIQDNPGCRLHFIGLHPGAVIPITHHKTMRDWEGVILDLR